jgi:hypothetical protein
MATHTNDVVPPFNFSEALGHHPLQRMRLCVDRVRSRLVEEGAWDHVGVPPVPAGGAGENELRELEARLGMPLPFEYRVFLETWRHLVIDDGLTVWGFDYEGLSIGSPWVSDEHRAGVRYLVFGDYWGYADGDQLMFDLSDPQQAVVAYLHEHGPLYEDFAPSFSLALWRMVHERQG